MSSYRSIVAVVAALLFPFQSLAAEKDDQLDMTILPKDLKTVVGPAGFSWKGTVSNPGIYQVWVTHYCGEKNVRAELVDPSHHVFTERERQWWATRQSTPTPVDEIEPRDAGGLDHQPGLTACGLRGLFGDRQENLGSTVS